jgi:hypothetical protein
MYALLPKFVPERAVMLTVVFVSPLDGVIEFRVGILDWLFTVNPLTRVSDCPAAFSTTTFHVPTLSPARGKEQVRVVVLPLQDPGILVSPLFFRTTLPPLAEKPEPLIVTPWSVLVLNPLEGEMPSMVSSVFVNT